MTPAGGLPVRTRFAEHVPELDDPSRAPGQPSAAWRRGRDGLVGWGEAARITVSGPDRFRLADEWWRDVVARCVVDDEVGLPGTGPVAFASFTFADGPSDSVLVVPHVVVGRSAGVMWRTEVGHVDVVANGPTVDSTDDAPVAVEFRRGTMDVEQWEAAVARVVARIRRGHARKVVFTRDVRAAADRAFDLGRLLRRCTSRYPQCWSFLVDGLVGATPEMLVRRRHRAVRSRVLAGTTWPGARNGGVAGAALLASVKDRAEHHYAVDSVVAALRPLCDGLRSPDAPSVLTLPDLSHLSSDVTAVLPEENRPTLFDLAAALHPSAAVGGHPTRAALDLIDEFEGMDRDRYTGPVGWVDRHGDGDLGIALRCARLTGTTARLFAGGGLVADSDPTLEAAETEVKLRAMRSVLAVEDGSP